MTDEKKPVQFAPPASQVDLEERLANGNRSHRVLSTADSYEPDESLPGRDFRVEGNDVEGYVGVSPEYATYSDETSKPLPAEDGPEAELEKLNAERLGVYESDEWEDEEEDKGTLSESAKSQSPQTSAPHAAAKKAESSEKN